MCANRPSHWSSILPFPGAADAADVPQSIGRSRRTGAKEADDWLDATLSGLKAAKQLQKMNLSARGLSCVRRRWLSCNRIFPTARSHCSRASRMIHEQPTPLTDDKP